MPARCERSLASHSEILPFYFHYQSFQLPSVRLYALHVPFTSVLVKKGVRVIVIGGERIFFNFSRCVNFTLF